MKNPMRVLLAAFIIVSSGFAVAACEQKGPAERAGEKIDKAGEKASDAVKDARDKAKDAVN
jgi:hypothetical protein